MRTCEFPAAAAAKSLQLCLTLCDSIDSSPPDSSVSGILQARALEWVAISFSNAWKWKWKWSRSVVSDFQRPHGLQPTRLLNPWDFPGKSTGVGCHCLLLLLGNSLKNIQLKTCSLPTFSSVQLLSHVWLFATPWTEATRPPCPSLTPRVYPNSCPLSWWCHQTISSPSLPTFNLSQHQGLFQWFSSVHQVAKVLEFQLQYQSFQWTLRTDLF